MSAGARERKIKAARKVVATLKAEKRHAEAQAINDLIRAHASLADTTARLWHDNMKLRENE